jgi:deoxyribodipyrimidine photolyase-related protein
MRHRESLAGNPRMSLQVKNLARLSALEQREIAAQAAALRDAPPQPD